MTILETMDQLLARRNQIIRDLSDALVTASHQNSMANRRILALEAELELARQGLAMAQQHRAMVAEPGPLRVPTATPEEMAEHAALFRAISR